MENSFWTALTIFLVPRLVALDRDRDGAPLTSSVVMCSTTFGAEIHLDWQMGWGSSCLRKGTAGCVPTTAIQGSLKWGVHWIGDGNKGKQCCFPPGCGTVDNISTRLPSSVYCPPVRLIFLNYYLNSAQIFNCYFFHCLLKLIDN